jgi:hypothetical protein
MPNKRPSPSRRNPGLYFGHLNLEKNLYLQLQMVAQLENCSVRRLAHAFLDNQLKRYFSLRENYEKLLKLQAHAERRQVR